MSSCIVILSTKNNSERDKKMVKKKTYAKYTTQKRINANIVKVMLNSTKTKIHRNRVKRMKKQLSKDKK